MKTSNHHSNNKDESLDSLAWEGTAAKEGVSHDISPPKKQILFLTFVACSKFVPRKDDEFEEVPSGYRNRTG